MKKSDLAIVSAAFLLILPNFAHARSSVNAEIRDAQGKKIGTARITAEGKRGARLRVDVKGLTPGPHGIHIHENGKCEGPDFKTAGSHFAGEGQKHGLTAAKPHHGDMPNLIADREGRARAEFTIPGISLEKNAPNSIFKSGGAAIVIHEKADDQKTDPAGDSGGRIACGVLSKG